MKAIGLMSGTSMDGVDVALIETDGEEITAFGPSMMRPYGEAERDLLLGALDDAASLSGRDARPGILAAAETLVTQSQAQAVKALMNEHRLNADDIGVIGFHGQTVLHRPEAGLTVQLGDGPRLADMTGIDVVYDFRAADMAAGGQGAPFVPAYHRALVERSQIPRPAVIVNLGGVANVTFVGADGELTAFDTGPGNALIDDWMMEKMGEPRDEDGALAATGLADRARLEQMLSNPFFLRKPPKSLDRRDFTIAAVQGLNAADGAATLTAFTAASLVCSLAHFPDTPAVFVLCGGGTHNATLVEALHTLWGGRIELADDLGWNADAIEAQAFAYLAVRSLRKLPLSFPGTTGVPEPTTGGVHARPPKLLVT
jgi:anhydro-N-acetylmuramic acid kinase